MRSVLVSKYHVCGLLCLHAMQEVYDPECTCDQGEHSMASHIDLRLDTSMREDIAETHLPER